MGNILESNDAMIDLACPVNRQHPLAQGLVAWYLCLPGTMGGAKWRDLMSPADLGQGNHGALTDMDPATDWVATERPGGFGALDFDGINDSIQYGNPVRFQGLQELTIFYNAKPKLAETGQIFTKGNSAYQEFVTEFGRYTEPKFRFFWGNNLMAASSGCSLNQWYNVANVRKGYFNNWVAEIYVDGQKQDSVVTSINPNGNEICFSGLAAWGQPYKGELDNIMLFNRALTDFEIRQLYESSKQGHPGLLRRCRRRTIFVPAAGGLSIPVAINSYRQRRVLV